MNMSTYIFNYQKSRRQNFRLQIFKKMSKLYHIEYYEPPHQDLRCLQIQLFSPLELKPPFHWTALVLRFKILAKTP